MNIVIISLTKVSWSIQNARSLSLMALIRKRQAIFIDKDCACVLGAPIGSDSFVHSWFKDKVQSWVEELNTPN